MNHIKNNHHCYNHRGSVGLTIILLVLTLAGMNLSLSRVRAQQANAPANDQLPASDLTGNWVVRMPNADGTFRLTYFNLKQEGPRITGSIRLTQFYYLIVESTGGAEGFTITAMMKDGKNERRVRYEGKLVGDELRIGTRRRPEDQLTELVAHRAPGVGWHPLRDHYVRCPGHHARRAGDSFRRLRIRRWRPGHRERGPAPVRRGRCVFSWSSKRLSAAVIVPMMQKLSSA